MKNGLELQRVTLRATVLLLILMAVTSVSISAYQKVKTFIYLPVPKLNVPAVKPDMQPVQIFDVKTNTVIYTTAYVPGLVCQTDSDPCIGADGTNLCKDLGKGEKICAANFVPLGTKLYIEGFGICTVRDRMSARYTNRVDVAMKRHKTKEAKKWGRKKSEVKVLR